MLAGSNISRVSPSAFIYTHGTKDGLEGDELSTSPTVLPFSGELLARNKHNKGRTMGHAILILSIILPTALWGLHYNKYLMAGDCSAYKHRYTLYTIRRQA